LVRACHPGPTVAVTSIAILLGVGIALPLRLLLLIAVTVFVGQLSIGWSNDWLDASRDRAAKRTEKPVASGAVSVTTLKAVALCTGALSVPLSLLAGTKAAACHLVLVASGWIYNVGLKRVVWSFVPYAIGFGALPAYVTLTGDVGVTWWMVTAGGLLGVAAHFANAAPDIESDLSVGVRGAPQRLGTRISVVVSLCLLAAAGSLAVLHLPSFAFVGWVVVAAPLLTGLALVVRDGGRHVFTLVMIAAVCDVALIVLAA
jgi:4-hydroxybenzoate polyprenyltransferase